MCCSRPPWVGDAGTTQWAAMSLALFINPGTGFLPLSSSPCASSGVMANGWHDGAWNPDKARTRPVQSRERFGNSEHETAPFEGKGRGPEQLAIMLAEEPPDA
jgi:hypothetical protein